MFFCVPQLIERYLLSSGIAVNESPSHSQPRWRIVSLVSPRAFENER